MDAAADTLRPTAGVPSSWVRLCCTPSRYSVLFAALLLENVATTWWVLFSHPAGGATPKQSPWPVLNPRQLDRKYRS